MLVSASTIASGGRPMFRSHSISRLPLFSSVHALDVWACL